MSEMQSLIDRVNALTAAVAWWNNTIIVMMIVAATAAGGLVIAQYVAFKKADLLAATTDLLAREKEKQLTLELKEKDDRIAANERLTAEANERSKLLEVESGKDKIEIERLKAINAPWDFMEGQQVIFKNELRTHPKGKILITYTSIDGIRASDFGNALNRVLKNELAFDVWGYVSSYQPTQPFEGVQLVINDDSLKPLQKSFVAAFRKIGIEPILTTGNSLAEPGYMDIRIGIRPRP